MSEIKLAKCPFCGGEFYIDVCGMIYIPKCKKCGCKLAGCRTQEEAIEEANTRKPMERIIERLEKIINRTKKEEKQNNDVVDTAMRCSYEHSMKIVKEEGGIE